MVDRGAYPCAVGSDASSSGGPPPLRVVLSFGLPGTPLADLRKLQALQAARCELYRVADMACLPGGTARPHLLMLLKLCSRPAAGFCSWDICCPLPWLREGRRGTGAGRRRSDPPQAPARLVPWAGAAALLSCCCTVQPNAHSHHKIINTFSCKQTASKNLPCPGSGALRVLLAEASPRPHACLVLPRVPPAVL